LPEVDHAGDWDIKRNLPAYSAAVAAAIFWARYSNLTRRWAGGQAEGAVVLFLPLTAAALLLVCCVVNEPREWSRRSLLETLFLGAATFAAYTLWDTAIRNVESAQEF
jgi:drug/metabolite transporter (DMT)-like permease